MFESPNHKIFPISIENKNSNRIAQFSGFLEDSEISYETKDQQLPFAPLSFTNDSIATRIIEKVKFTFIIIGYDHRDCLVNWYSFSLLRKDIRPRYQIINEQYMPNIENLEGLLTIKSKILPRGREKINIHLTNFSYNINKELGMFAWDIKDENKPYSDVANLLPDEDNNLAMIPVSFKVQIEGKVLLDIDETLNTEARQEDTASAKINERQKKETRRQQLERKIILNEQTLILNGLATRDPRTGIITYKHDLINKSPYDVNYKYIKTYRERLEELQNPSED